MIWDIMYFFLCMGFEFWINNWSHILIYDSTADTVPFGVCKAMRRTTKSISQSAKQTKKEGGKRKLHKLRMLSRIRKLRYTINLMGKKDLRLRKLFPRKFEARRDRSPSTASQSSTISLQGTTISKNSQSTSNYVQRRRTTRQIPKHRPIDLANLLVGSDEEIFLVKCLLLFFLLIWFSI